MHIDLFAHDVDRFVNRIKDLAFYSFVALQIHKLSCRLLRETRDIFWAV